MSVAERLSELSDRAAHAARSAGRSTDELTIIPVTKLHPASLVRQLYGLGVRDVAENRHQEARQKVSDLSDLAGLRWHFVGQLQTKKARQVREYARAIHSVDRPELVAALASETLMTDVFVQVNLTDDPRRGGAAPAEIPRLAEAVLATEGLRLLGVMAVAPRDEEPRSAFSRLRLLSERVRSIESSACSISSGMSSDFEAAILEGATHLRIGTAITGNRAADG